MEAKFASMIAEWSVANELSVGLPAHWEQKFVELQTDELRLRDAGRWIYGRDDFLGVLGRHRDELTHSRMIAWLLDPCAPHGFGTSILEELLATLHGHSPVAPGLARVRTRCEVQLVDGRLDVVVEGPGLYLVIENKVDADESDEQCTYYSQHLRLDSLCILLSPDGRESRTASTFKPLKYSKFADIIDQAMTRSPRSSNGREIVEDYLRTLRREFP